MGFSKSCFEQYKRELRILWRTLAVGAVVAAGVHVFSVPRIIRYGARLMELPKVEPEAPPVELVIIEEDIDIPEPEEVVPPPAEEDAPSNEPAAAADQASPPPLPSEAAVPEPVAADVDTVPVTTAIAADNAVEEGQGAVGTTNTIGIVPGTGSPSEPTDAPAAPAYVRAQQPVPEIARARPDDRSGSRMVSCNPCSRPDYPLSAQRDDTEGQPVINVIFDEDGTVVEAVLESSSGNAALDQAALEEARRNWQFNDPSRMGGQVSVEVTFVMEGSEQYDAAQAAGSRTAMELPEQQAVTPVTPTSAAVPPTSTSIADPAPDEAASNETASGEPPDSEGIGPNAAAPSAPNSEPPPSNASTSESPFVEESNSEDTVSSPDVAAPDAPNGLGASMPEGPASAAEIVPLEAASPSTPVGDRPTPASPATAEPVAPLAEPAPASSPEALLPASTAPQTTSPPQAESDAG